MTYLKNLAFAVKHSGKKVSLKEEYCGKVMGFRKGKILIQVLHPETQYRKLYDIIDIKKEEAN